MAVSTKNYYGNIEISANAIAAVAGFAALDTYGVVDLIPKGFKSTFANLFKKQAYTKGVVININKENRIFIDIYCKFKYGISISAIAESLKKTIKYTVEDFTGMIVDTVNVHVVGVNI